MSDKYKPDGPVFCGNFEYDAPAKDIERLFDKYGPVDKIDLKTGFAFVYMRDRRDADDAIAALDGREFGYKRRRLRVEWAKGHGDVKRKEDERKSKQTPNTTLFITNFDLRTRERDLERLYDKYGRLTRVQIKKTFAFVQFEDLADAERAFKETSNMEWDGRTLAVEYVTNDLNRPSVGERRRSRSRSPAYRRRSYSPRRRSPPPRRASPPSPRRRSRSPPPSPRDRAPRRSRSRSPRRGSPPPRRDSPRRSSPSRRSP